MLGFSEPRTVGANFFRMEKGDWMFGLAFGWNDCSYFWILVCLMCGGSFSDFACV